MDVSLLVDARAAIPATLAAKVQEAGIEILAGAVVTRAKGFGKLRAVDVAGLSSDGKSVVAPKRTVVCDLLAMSGGWSPVVHLMCHKGGRPSYDPARLAFLPGDLLGLNQSAVGGAPGIGRMSCCHANFENTAAGRGHR